MPGETFHLIRQGHPQCAVVVGPGKGDEEAAQRFADHVAEVSGVDIPLVGPGERPPAPNLVHLGTLSDESQALALLRRKRTLVSWDDREEEEYKRFNIPADLGDEGFVFDAVSTDDANHLVLGGPTRQGTLYAATTAAQRLCRRGDGLVINHIDTILQPRINVPLFRHRSVVAALGGPDFLAAGSRQWEKEWGRPDGTYDWRGYVDYLVGHRLNNLTCMTFELGWGISYDSQRFPDLVNPHHPNVQNEYMYELLEYAAQQGIATWLMLNLPENWSNIIRLRPHLAGKNVDLSESPSAEEWQSFLRGGTTTEQVRRTVGWVCAAEPEVRQIWRDYVAELVERYPMVRGIGGQFGEFFNQACDCSVCSERYFDIEREVFEDLVNTVQARDPTIIPWIYDSWGTREIVKHADSYPNFVNVDWGKPKLAYKFHSRRQLPRSQWYFQNSLALRWHEDLTRFGTRTLLESGVEGYQIRAGFSTARDETYHALQEFTWNAALQEDDFARLHIIRRYHRDDDALARLYGTWIGINRCRHHLENQADLVGWMDLDEVRRDMDSQRAQLTESLGRVKDRDDFIDDIARDFEEARPDLDALARS